MKFPNLRLRCDPKYTVETMKLKPVNFVLLTDAELQALAALCEAQRLLHVLRATDRADSYSGQTWGDLSHKLLKAKERGRG